MEFLVELKDPYQKPIKFKARPLPFAIKEQVKEALNEQIDAGLIRKSRSEWAAPLHVVHKPDGSVRLTVDFKGLNEVIKFDPYPMPNSKDLFSKLTQSKYFSKLDFIKAYHQFPTAKESIKYTSFICEFGQYEYPTMPMGIKTAAAWFQRCVDQVLKPFIDDEVVQVNIRTIPNIRTTTVRHAEPEGCTRQIKKKKWNRQRKIGRIKLDRTNRKLLLHIKGFMQRESIIVNARL